MPELFDSYPAEHVICVFGSGDATLSANYICQRRVFAGLEAYYAKNADKLVFYGRHQPSMTHTNKTEAETMKEFAYLNAPHDHAFPCDVVLVDDDSIINTSKTCEHIARTFLLQGDHVYLVINWIFMPRTLYLLKKWVIGVGGDWDSDKHRVHLVHCGGVFGEYFYHQGLRAAKRLITVPAREAGAWIYAITDPLTRNMNRRRKLPWQRS